MVILEHVNPDYILLLAGMYMELSKRGDNSFSMAAILFRESFKGIY